jgi:hypothetical protein
MTSGYDATEAQKQALQVLTRSYRTPTKLVSAAVLRSFGITRWENLSPKLQEANPDLQAELQEHRNSAVAAAGIEWEDGSGCIELADGSDGTHGGTSEDTQVCPIFALYADGHKGSQKACKKLHLATGSGATEAQLQTLQSLARRFKTPAKLVLAAKLRSFGITHWEHLSPALQEANPGLKSELQGRRNANTENAAASAGGGSGGNSGSRSSSGSANPRAEVCLVHALLQRGHRNDRGGDAELCQRLHLDSGELCTAAQLKRLGSALKKHHAGKALVDEARLRSFGVFAWDQLSEPLQAFAKNHGLALDGNPHTLEVASAAAQSLVGVAAASTETSDEGASLDGIAVGAPFEDDCFMGFDGGDAEQEYGAEQENRWEEEYGGGEAGRDPTWRGSPLAKDPSSLDALLSQVNLDDGANDDGAYDDGSSGGGSSGLRARDQPPPLKGSGVRRGGRACAQKPCLQYYLLLETGYGRGCQPTKIPSGVCTHRHDPRHPLTISEAVQITCPQCGERWCHGAPHYTAPGKCSNLTKDGRARMAAVRAGAAVVTAAATQGSAFAAAAAQGAKGAQEEGGAQASSRSDLDGSRTSGTARRTAQRRQGHEAAAGVSRSTVFAGGGDAAADEAVEAAAAAAVAAAATAGAALAKDDDDDEAAPMAALSSSDRGPWEGRLAPFRLERYFAKHEFRAQHLLCCSDPEPLTMAGVLSRASPSRQKQWQRLALGYTESRGWPPLLAAISGGYAPGCVPATGPLAPLVAAPQECIFLAMTALLEDSAKQGAVRKRCCRHGLTFSRWPHFFFLFFLRICFSAASCVALLYNLYQACFWWPPSARLFASSRGRRPLPRWW